MKLGGNKWQFDALNGDRLFLMSRKDAPNRRLADKLCPRGYRVIEQSRGKPEPDAQIQTNWTIRCL